MRPRPVAPDSRVPMAGRNTKLSVYGEGRHGKVTMADNTSPPHSVMRRLIRPFEYRHLHAVGGVRLAAGGFQLGVGLVLVSLGRQARTDRERRKCYGWAAWFLGIAALQLLGGYMDMTVASSERRPPA
jgi:hypothetical protein